MSNNISVQVGGGAETSALPRLTPQDEAELDEMIAAIGTRFISARGIIVSMMYAFAFTQFSDAFWRSFGACVAIYILMILPLGRSFIEKVGCVIFLTALFRWIDSPIVNRLVSAGLAKLDAML
ncbi:hypothetical protein SAMN05216374_0196 [Tardiphaga sp. OK246]|uniref:hypothetical protein n=1 Tax=Tardiphaga sp. OK246 TaxID=1855307 RepID=UPI000B65E707|nr:hypothetical protein [Tardiphaga sp. OK246]SNT63937.1 hypothetical protein SAMN05216374_0196 [Tardiphaga sp. OK246]